MKPQGSPEIAANAAISPGDAPCSASHAGKAMLIRPIGSPWEM
ncbi:MAG: hypothetical protein U5O39_13605 [Gammaproteobacteria bacterium]|nr:hypothetical protein [Gammaproteobacteria bacterium]